MVHSHRRRSLLILCRSLLDRDKVWSAAREKELSTEGEANAVLAKANVEAEAIRVKANAETEANKKIAASLTPELLDKQKLNKWNGGVPQTILGSGSNTVYVVD